MSTTTNPLSIQKEQSLPLLDNIKTEDELAPNDGDALSRVEVWRITTNEQSGPLVATKSEDSCLPVDCMRVKDESQADETNALFTGLEVELINPDFIGNGLVSGQLWPEALHFEMSSPILALENKVTHHSFRMEEHEHRKMLLGNDGKITRELVPFLQKNALNLKRDEVLTQETSDTCCQNESQENSLEYTPTVSISNKSVRTSTVRPYKKEKGLLELNHNFDEVLLANVSVRLEDIFSGNTDKFGNCHSAIGLCSCIFCQGKFNITDMQFLPKIPPSPAGKVNCSGLKPQHLKRNMVQHKLRLKAHVKVEPLVKCELDTKPLVCDLCLAIFTRRADLWKHKRHHFKKDKKPFKCKECGKGFKHKCALQNHSLKHSSERPFKCTICPKTYKHKENLLGHMKLHSGENVFKCNLCSKMFDAKSKLETHLRVHSNERPFSCKLCPATFKQSGQLPVHMRCVHRDERLFNCSQCYAPFKQRSALNAHMKYAHTAERPFKCDQCPAAFKDKRYLKNHKYVHIRNRLFECDTCKMRFKSKDSLRFHVVVHSKNRPFSCENCSRTFKTKMHVYQHILTHDTAIRQFQCEHCYAKFRTKTILKSHLIMHSHERPFSCVLCPAKFKQKGQLSSHEALHSDVKPYACEVCNVKFKLKSSVRKHQIMHVAERPFKCADCGFTSKYKSSLRGHIKSVHSNERPFKCKHCTLAFKLARTLKVHIRSVHFNEKPYSCTVCEYKCAESGTLKSHLLAHSNDRPVACDGVQ